MMKPTHVLTSSIPCLSCWAGTSPTRPAMPSSIARSSAKTRSASRAAPKLLITASASVASASSLWRPRNRQSTSATTPAPPYQLRRYAYSTGLPLSILTNFREFAVYDTRIKPSPNDGASAARIQYFTFEAFPDKWAFLASTFSREAILRGAFDKYAEGSIDDLISQSCSAFEEQETLDLTNEEARRVTLGRLSTILGFRIDRIVKYDVDPEPVFWMEVNGSRRVRIGTIDVIVQLHKFSNKVLGTVGEMIPDFDRRQWRRIATLIVKCAETAEGIVDGRFEDSTKSLINEYLLATKIGDDANDAAALGMPFVDKEGHVFIVLQSLKQWIYYTRHKDIREQDLAQFLTNIGCVNRRMHFIMKSSGKSITPHVWMVPPELVPHSHRS